MTDSRSPDTSAVRGGPVSRRTLAKGVAWAMPVVATATAVPWAAASPADPLCRLSYVKLPDRTQPQPDDGVLGPSVVLRISNVDDPGSVPTTAADPEIVDNPVPFTAARTTQGSTVVITYSAARNLTDGEGFALQIPAYAGVSLSYLLFYFYGDRDLNCRVSNQSVRVTGPGMCTVSPERIQGCPR